jgi:hypothetical protein
LRLKLDTLITLRSSRTDSLANNLNTRVDSVAAVNKRVGEKLNALQHVRLSGLSTDTLKRKVNGDSSKVAETRIKLQNKIDSLNGLNLPTAKYATKLDSLNKKNPLNKVHEAERALSGTQSKIQSKVNKPVNEANAAIGKLNGEAEGFGNLPTNVGAPDVTKQLDPKMSSPGLTTPSMALDQPGISTGNLSGAIPETNVDINGELQSMTEDSKIAGGVGDISKVSQDVATYSEDVKAVTSGDFQAVKQLDEDALAKIQNDDFNAAQGELGRATEQMETLKSLKNQDSFKAHAVEKGREIVIQQIATHQTGIVQTVNKLSQHQRRAGTVFSKVKGLPKRPLKQKKPPVLERIVPGITLQVQKASLWWLDLNPSVHYRIKSILSAGIGWNQRILFDDHVDFHKEGRIYGVRSFAELSVLKGLWLRAEVERMNITVPVIAGQPDERTHRLMWNYVVGAKKDFSLASRVTGNVQFMYNLYDPDNLLPYQNRFNVRFGFEMQLKKRSKQKVQ